MDYEVMMNGNVKIGMYAPDFEATSTISTKPIVERLIDTNFINIYSY